MCDLAEVTATYVALIQIQQLRWQMWNEVTKMCKMATPKPCKRHAKWLLCAPSLAFKHTAAHILHTWTAFTCSILSAHWQHLTTHQSAAKFKICRFSLKFNLFISAFPGFDRESLGWKSLAGQQLQSITWEYAEHYKNIRENAVWQFGICSFDMFWYILTSPCFPCLVRNVPMFPHVPPCSPPCRSAPWYSHSKQRMTEWPWLPWPW